MRVLLKWSLRAIVCLLVLGTGGVSYFLLAYPRVRPAPDLRIEATPERLARGKYLADHVAICTDCHSQRDWTGYGGPVKPAFYGAGGEVFDESMGLPGRIVSRNITPGALASWSDGEILRAMLDGVSKDGSALFPLMPYPTYGKHLDPEDARAIIAYLRTIPASSHQPERTRLNFPLPLIVRTLPAPAEAAPTRPEPSDRLAYGRYLTTIASCSDCHATRNERGEIVPGREYAGGAAFEFPGGSTVRGANLTPHATGLGSWTEADFIQRFRAAQEEERPVGPGDFNTLMPWKAYAGMTDEDLGAIFQYLRSLPPVDNPVQKFTRASDATVTQ